MKVKNKNQVKMENQTIIIANKSELNQIIRRAMRPTHTNFYEGRDFENGNVIITLGVWDVKKFEEASYSLPIEMYVEVAPTLKPMLYAICSENDVKCQTNPNLQ